MRAEEIDHRLGPIPGQIADDIALQLRAAASQIEMLYTALERYVHDYDPNDRNESNAASVLLRLLADRDDQDRALRDAISEVATTADELAFWKYQAIWQRAVRLQHDVITAPYIEDTKAWKEAERQLEDARTAQNRERVSHAEASRDPGAT